MPRGKSGRACWIRTALKRLYTSRVSLFASSSDKEKKKRIKRNGADELGVGDDKSAGGAPGAGVVEKKNAEASSTQGAFNEETGEINWDCPVRFPLPFVAVFDERLIEHSVWVEWPTVLVANSSKPPFHVSYSQRPSRKAWTASKSSN